MSTEILPLRSAAARSTGCTISGTWRTRPGPQKPWPLH